LSGIAGIINLNGEPLDHTILEKMLRVAGHRGPDGNHLWHRANAGLGQLLLATTPEAEFETHPLFDPDSGSCIVFDGRLDNRSELLSSLKSGGVVLKGNSDMEIVLRCFDLWGKACAGKLLGDFSFAIWNLENKRLFCCRDLASVRPFYYFFRRNGWFVFGSELTQILQHPAVSRRPNEGFIGEILACAFVSKDETIYQDIKRLPGGHFIELDPAHCSIKAYWDFNALFPIRYRKPEEYLEHYNELFLQSVACRLRTDRDIGITLSGGLDSPSIAGAAETLFRRQPLRFGFESFSLTFPGRPCDESRHIAESVRHWNLGHHESRFTDFKSRPQWPENANYSGDLPTFPTASAFDELYAIARARNIRVILDGSSAESWVGGSDYPYLGALRNFQFDWMLRELIAQKQENGMHFGATRFVRSLAWPLLPIPIRKLLERQSHKDFDLEFIDPGWMDRIGLKDRLRCDENPHRFSDLANWQACKGGFGGIKVFGLEADNRFDSTQEIEHRYPFADRRLIEFSLGMPDYIKRLDHNQKFLIRAMGKNYLPQRIRDQPFASDVICIYEEALAHPSVRRTLKSIALPSSEWISERKLQSKMDGFEAMHSFGKPVPEQLKRYIAPMWLAYAIKIWQTTQIDA